jgi:hypothetical protein
MDIFSGIVPEGDDLFQHMPEPDQPQAPTLSPAQQNKTARVAALALTDPSKPDLLGQMDAMLQDVQTTLDKYGDVDLRRKAAAADTLSQFNSLTEVITSRDAQIDPTLAIGASAAAQTAIMADQAKAAQFALEKRAIERIQDLAAAGDTAQARMLLNNIQNGDSNQVIRDMNTKALILEREINKAKQNTEDDWIGSAANFVLSALPFYQSSGQVGNVDIEKGLKGWADWMFSGKRVQMESNTLWNMPVEDFSDFVQNELIPKIRDKSTLLGFEDNHKELSTLSKLQRPSGVLSQNAWDGLANLGWIGPAELSKAVSIPGLLVRNGARKEAAGLLAQTALAIRTEGAEAAIRKTAIEAEELVDNMLPHVVNPRVQVNIGDTVLAPDLVPGVSYKIVENIDGDVPRVLLRDETGNQSIMRLDDIQPVGRSDISTPKIGEKITIPSVTGGQIYTVLDNAFDASDRIVIQDAGGGLSIRPKSDVQLIEQKVPQVTTEGAAATVSLQNSVNTVIEQTEKIMDQFKALNQLGRLTTEESQAAIQATIDRVSKEHGETLIQDVSKPQKVRLSDGTSFNRVEFTVGLFDDKDTALNYARETGLGDTLIRDESGKFSLRVVKDVSETGFITEVLKPQATGFLSRVLLSARAVGDRLLANMGQSAGNTRAKLLKTFVRDYSKKFSVLSRREREDLAQVLAVGEANAEWYSRDQLELLYERAYKRPPSERELIAYDTARNLNDIEYMLRNDEVYKQKVVQGYESVTSEVTGEVNGRVINDWQVLPTDRIYNISDKVGYSKVSPMLSEDMTRLKGEGYVLVKTDQAVKLEDGTVTNAILAKKSDLTIKPLRRDQITYRAGGHRIYEGKYFAKQARIGVQPDGEKFLQNPATFIVGKTKAEVDYWTNQMERARQLYVANADDAAIKNALPTNVTLEQFQAGMLDGTFDPDQVFRTAYDRETLPEYVNTTGYSDMRDLDETDIQQYLRTSGRMYYGHKGEILPDWQGSQAPTLDPFKTIERSLFNVANLSSFSDYKISAAERWHNTFGGYLNQTGISPMSAIREGTFGLNVPEAIRQAAEAQRDIIRRTLGWKTEFDRQQEIYTRRFAEWVAGDDPYSLRNKVTSSVSEWFDNNHPIQALRGLAFDLKLGLFNVAQFPLQIGTLAAATTISPKYGLQGMIGLFPMKVYLTKSGTEAMLDTLVQRGTHVATGFADPAEYKEYMKFAKRSGFFDIGSTHQLINDYGPNAAVGAFSKLDNIREAARFWFYEGELWNRMVAWRIAWGETKEKFPQLATDTPEFMGEVTGRAEEFAFSMSDQSSAAWQKGITSIPTQFWAYNARMLEAMFGKTFTPAQKARLILGQTLMFGAAGVPVAPYILDKINANRGETAPVNSLEGLVTRGLMDQVIYHMSGGQDLLVSKRYGTGAFITDTLKDIFGMSAYGEKSMAEIVGGASYSIAYAGFETVIDLLKYMTAESGGETKPLTEDALLRLAKNVSTVSNAHKAYMVHKYGTLVTGKGTTLAANIPSQSAWAVALGISPSEVDDVTAAMQYLQNDREAVDEAVKTITNYRTRMVNEPDNREDIYEEINAYVKLLPPEVRIQALKKAQSRLQPSLLDGLSLQVEKDRVRAEALRNMEEGDNGADRNAQ